MSLFVTCSAAAQPVHESVILVVDIGCNPDGERTLTAIEQQKASVVVFLGDLSYEAEASCFTDMVNKLASDVIILGVIGNHDSEEELSATLESNYLNFLSPVMAGGILNPVIIS